LMHLKRMMTEREICRLQGIPDDRVNYVHAKVSRGAFLRAVGNAMSSNVLARLLACAWLSWPAAPFAALFAALPTRCLRPGPPAGWGLPTLAAKVPCLVQG
jgi:hypothetical protein